MMTIEVKSCLLMNRKCCEYSFVVKQNPLIQQGNIFNHNGHAYIMISNPAGHVNGTNKIDGIDRCISLETLFTAE